MARTACDEGAVRRHRGPVQQAVRHAQRMFGQRDVGFEIAHARRAFAQHAARDADSSGR